MSRAFVAGIGLRGPGLPGWAASLAILRGEAPLPQADVEAPMPALLPPNERRRTSLVTRLALAVAEEAVTSAGLPLDAVRAVFGSANGDPPVIVPLLETLAVPDKPLSPTLFHNSVHNAVAGYWSIAAGSRQPFTCLGAYDASCGAALLKAVTEVAVEQAPVLLCLYDMPLPAPLDPTPRAARGSFAMALVLLPAEGAAGLPRLAVGYEARPALPEDCLPRDPALAALTERNAAALSLRLLQSLARGEADRLAFPMLDGRITVDLTAAECI